MAGAFYRSLRADQEVVARAVCALRGREERVASFVAALHGCGGTILPTALGKSAAAAIRLASSLRALGARAHWVHAAEWSHGDLGAVRADDVLVCISNSGRTAELLALAVELRARPRPPTLLAITGDERSPLAQLACAELACPVPSQHEILGLIPAGSAIAQDVLVNAVVAQLAELRRTTAADVMATHPGGAIGEAARRTRGAGGVSADAARDGDVVPREGSQHRARAARDDAGRASRAAHAHVLAIGAADACAGARASVPQLCPVAKRS
ncbi:hypothetical protein KFE25_005359 [Diacronema lutheri]|uniref:SIS domain-containing protein n=1 Tax=Diacronema lutheri TaxID=2081491 RepID=A0A8J6CAR5_DIALT|nr:hypothetical protein KFE25_005359 [Diacronema lutheri]